MKTIKALQKVVYSPKVEKTTNPETELLSIRNEGTYTRFDFVCYAQLLSEPKPWYKTMRTFGLVYRQNGGIVTSPLKKAINITQQNRDKWKKTIGAIYFTLFFNQLPDEIDYLDLVGLNNDKSQKFVFNNIKMASNLKVQISSTKNLN
jgi:hypothetical protein